MSGIHKGEQKAQISLITKVLAIISDLRYTLSVE
jgi:hypothetical protein